MNEDKSVKELLAHNEIGHILWTLWSNRHVLDGNYACCQVRILLESAERAAEHIGQHFRDCQCFMRTFSSHAPRPTLTQSEYFISFKKYFFVYWNKDSISEHVCKVMYLRRHFGDFKPLYQNFEQPRPLLSCLKYEFSYQRIWRTKVYDKQYLNLAAN